MEKFVNIQNVYDIIHKVVNNINITTPERLELQRFRDKITDSEQFALEAHKQFYHAYNIKVAPSTKVLFDNKHQIRLDGGFWLKHNGRNWELWHFTDKYLDSLDTKTAKGICKDINVAIRIKLSQEENYDN